MWIGITGHQRLEKPEAWVWIEDAMNRELDNIGQPVVAVSSLAEGADQLFAMLVVRRRGTVYAVLPFAGYEKKLEGQDLTIYRNLLEGAEVEVLQVTGTEEDAYLAAGKRVVELSDLMFAVWDGQSAKGKGGTSDIVAYSREKGVKLLQFNPLDRTVMLL